MTVFADSSAIVKLYADEDGAEVVRGLPTLTIAHLTRVEVPAALWRKSRSGSFDAPTAAVLVAEFEADLFGTVGAAPRFTAVAVRADLLDDAAHLSGVHALRAYDAVQLASARAVAAVDPDFSGFVVVDRDLRAAAAAEGIALVP